MEKETISISRMDMLIDIGEILVRA